MSVGTPLFCWNPSCNLLTTLTWNVIHRSFAVTKLIGTTTTNRIPPVMGLSLAKLTSTGSHLFRSLLSLVVRLSRLRVAPTLRCWIAFLWRSILTFARHRDQSRIRWHTNDAPMLASAPNPGEGSNAEPDTEHSGTLATPPTTIDWKDTLLKLQKLTSNCQVKPVEVLPATPERGGSQRYKAKTPE